MFHPPREVLERVGVKLQVSQWLRQARAPADVPSLQAGGASSSPISGGELSRVRTRCRATKRSAQSRQSARRSHWRRTGFQLPASSTVYSVSMAGGGKCASRGILSPEGEWRVQGDPRARGRPPHNYGVTLRWRVPPPPAAGPGGCLGTRLGAAWGTADWSTTRGCR